MGKRDKILLATAVCGAASVIGCCCGLIAMTFPFASGATGEVALIPAFMSGGISLVVWPLRMPLRSLLGLILASVVMVGMAMVLPILTLIAPMALYTIGQWAVLPVAGSAAVYVIAVSWLLRDELQRSTVMGALVLSAILLVVAATALTAAFDGEMLGLTVLRFASAAAPFTALTFGLAAGWFAVLLGGARAVEPGLSPSFEALR